MKGSQGVIVCPTAALYLVILNLRKTFSPHASHGALTYHERFLQGISYLVNALKTLVNRLSKHKMSLTFI